MDGQLEKQQRLEVNMRRKTIFPTGLCVLFFGLPTVFPAVASAAAKQCCNTSTGDFTADNEQVCRAKPGHVFMTPETMAQAAICFQKAAQQAQQMMGQPLPGGITLPTMPQGPGSSGKGLMVP